MASACKNCDGRPPSCTAVRLPNETAASPRAAGADWPDALAALVKDDRLRKIDLQRIDGVAVHEGPHADRLRTAGFVDGYRGLAFRG